MAVNQRAEYEWDAVDAPRATVGTAEAGDAEEHAGHAFLYVPDLSSQTGWSGHRVPAPTEGHKERREMGFRR